MNRRTLLASLAASAATGADKKLLLPSDQPDEHKFRLMWYNPVPPIDQSTWRLNLGGLVEKPSQVISSGSPQDSGRNSKARA